MTTAPPHDTSSLPAGSDDEDGDPTDLLIRLPAAGTGDRARRRRRVRRRARIHRVSFAAALTMLTLAVPILTWVGFREVVESRSGVLVDQQRDPDAPGFEAVVERTPTALVVQLGPDGVPVSVTVLALSPGDAGGAVLFIPVTTVVYAQNGVAPLAAAYDTGGLAGIRDATALLVGIGFDETIEVDGDRLATLAAPVAPIAVDNPDDVEGEDENGKAVTLFPAGRVDLTAEQVAVYLAARGAEESDLARLVRQQALWEGWLAAVAASADPGVVPGEIEVGIGRFVRGLAAGAVRYETLPVAAAPPDIAGEGELFQAQPAAVSAVVADIVPFPVSPVPGARPRVRLLDGGPDVARRDVAAHILVRAGAEVDIVGNADRFGYLSTSIVYYDPAREADATRLRDALGVGEMRFEPADSDRTDVTVVLGADFGGGTNTTTTGDGPTG